VVVIVFVSDIDLAIYQVIVKIKGSARISKGRRDAPVCSWRFLRIHGSKSLPENFNKEIITAEAGTNDRIWAARDFSQAILGFSRVWREAPV